MSRKLCSAKGMKKSPVFHLMLFHYPVTPSRFYEPQEGEIYFDGKNIKNLDIGDLRSQLAMVDQNPTLFAMSIFENVKVGNARGE